MLLFFVWIDSLCNACIVLMALHCSRLTVITIICWSELLKNCHAALACCSITLVWQCSKEYWPYFCVSELWCFRSFTSRTFVLYYRLLENAIVFFTYRVAVSWSKTNVWWLSFHYISILWGSFKKFVTWHTFAFDKDVICVAGRRRRMVFSHALEKGWKQCISVRRDCVYKWQIMTRLKLTVSGHKRFDWTMLLSTCILS